MSCRPLISVLIPNYNNDAYLDERFKSILGQSYTNLEIIVCDSFSTDGAWTIIQKYAYEDRRVHAIQVPKEGIYAGWNECLKRATGEFVYMATSDDSMTSDCLAKLVDALASHSDCSIAMCALQITSEDGRPIAESSSWRAYPAPRYFDKIFNVSHRRLAPLDGLLSGVLHNAWHSVTQLLVKRSVYERHGYYRTDLGSIADFEWNARVAFFENVIYIPQPLATLRVHEKSASEKRGRSTVSDIDEKILILKIVSKCVAAKAPEWSGVLDRIDWQESFRYQRVMYILKLPLRLAFPLLVKAFFLYPRDILGLLVVLYKARGFDKGRIRSVLVERLTNRAEFDVSKHVVPL